MKDDSRHTVFSSFLPYTITLIAIIMGCLISLCSRDVYIKIHFPTAFFGQNAVPDILWGFTNAVFPLGGCIGTFLATHSGSKYGRKPTTIFMLIIGIISMVEYIYSFYCRSFSLFFLSRFGQGLSSGGIMNIGLIYLMDLIPQRSAKITSLIIQPFINLGIVISGLFSLDIITQNQWKITAYPVSILFILSFILILLLPESPLFLIKNGYSGSSVKSILLKLRRGNYEKVVKEYEKIRKNASKNEKNLSIKDLLKDKRMKGPLVVSTLISIFQQISGINIVIFYISQFIVAANFKQIDLGSLIAFVVCFVGSVIFSFIIPFTGSKKMMVIGYAGMSISFGLAYILIYIVNIPLLTVILLSLFLFWFQCGPGPKPWVVFKETFPPEYQSAAQGFLTLCNWIANFLMTAFFPFALSKIGFHSIALFAVINLVFAIILAIMMVETKNKTYEEIQSDYKKRLRILY